MIRALVPSTVPTVETREDLVEADLFPAEAVAVSQAVDKRRREFATGRACARRALERLGVAATAIPIGERGEPLWPAGVVGSITHCQGYRASAVAKRSDVASVGIDAEVHGPLPDGVFDAIATRRERRRLAGGHGEVCLDKVLFSAKESVYKAWFPLAQAPLGFEDVDLVIDVADRAFRARLLVPGPVTELSGRWAVVDDIVLTAVVVRS